MALQAVHACALAKYAIEKKEKFKNNLKHLKTKIMATDWNDDAKSAVTTGLGMIPEVGSILSCLVGIFWPSSKEDVWGEIKTQVEALVNQAISDNNYQLVSDSLEGLNNDLTDYVNAANSGDETVTGESWITAKMTFDKALPDFQMKGYQLLLSPLFAQFANMYLSLLRDGVAFGKSWGWNDNFLQQTASDLTNSITSFISYANDTYNTGYDNIVKNTKADYHACQPFKAVNTFTREFTLSLLDYMNMWAYFDVTKYPNGTNVLLTREIYTDPMGTCDDSGNITIPSAPTQRPTGLTVWGGDRIDAVQLTYPQGAGPGGVTQTPRMGDQDGGSNQSPHGGVFNIDVENPVIQARATYGSIVNCLQFLFNDGTTTDMFGGSAGWGSNDSGLMGYLWQFVSSVHINGVSDFYGCADCVVFGFQYWQPPEATLSGIRALYVASPIERSADEFAKFFPKVQIPDDFITEDLQAKRKAYWDYMKQKSKVEKIAKISEAVVA
ncbi:MAG TPA: insecticidal delta-endotoxin Cry8Ea1 family protein [Parafilimonas sp.]|nr:insecticidal delta-endotoxin Cry8Ea1 family protein [Parafilimonas sp.]